MALYETEEGWGVKPVFSELKSMVQDIHISSEKYDCEMEKRNRQGNV